MTVVTPLDTLFPNVLRCKAMVQISPIIIKIRNLIVGLTSQGATCCWAHGWVTLRWLNIKHNSPLRDVEQQLLPPLLEEHECGAAHDSSDTLSKHLHHTGQLRLLCLHQGRIAIVTNNIEDDKMSVGGIRDRERQRETEILTVYIIHICVCVCIYINMYVYTEVNL